MDNLEQVFEEQPSINSNSANQNEDHIKADEERKLHNFIMKKDYVKSTVDFTLIFSLDQSLILDEPLSCSDCHTIFPGVWLERELKINGNVCPYDDCNAPWTSETIADKIKQKRQAKLEQISVECPLCKKVIDYNALFGHAETCLTELPCRYCGA